VISSKKKRGSHRERGTSGSEGKGKDSGKKKGNAFKAGYEEGVPRSYLEMTRPREKRSMADLDGGGEEMNLFRRKRNYE